MRRIKWEDIPIPKFDPLVLPEAEEIAKGLEEDIQICGETVFYVSNEQDKKIWAYLEPAFKRKGCLIEQEGEKFTIQYKRCFKEKENE